MVALAVDDSVLKHTAIVTIILYLKFQFTNLRLGGSRIKSGARPPEDVSLFGEKAGPQDFGGATKLNEFDKAAAAAAKKKKDDDDDTNNNNNKEEERLEKVKRAKMDETRAARLVMNDLENIPLGLIIAWMDALCFGSAGVHIFGVWLFCICRCVHSYAYINALPFHRSISWGIGLLATLILSFNTFSSVMLLGKTN